MHQRGETGSIVALVSSIRSEIGIEVNLDLVLHCEDCATSM
jgi:hypothetical protein